MNNKLTKALIGAAVLALAAGGALAQQDDRFDPKKPRKPAVVDKAGSGAPKDAPQVKDKGQARNATVAATGDRAGPSACDVHIDNRTDWVIHRVYIDGRNWGSVGRYGDSFARNVAMGPTRLYAEADFTDGSKRFWGPRNVPCDPWSTFTWTLQ